jgi:signal transduction histidine kinase
MEQLKRVTRYDSGSLFLQEGEELVLAKVTNVAERYIGYRIPLTSANSLIQVFKQKQPMIIAEVGADPRWQMIAEDPIQSWMGAPLLIGQKAIGVLTADSFEIGAYTQEDVQILEAFASQAALAIENAELYQQAQQAAADEERNRLARNLHDSVTQALFSATLVAEVLPQVWQRDPEKAQQGLEKLSRLTKGALAEMRALLLELRPKALLQARLNDLLGQLSQAVAGQSPLDIRLETEPIPTLPPEVQLTFYRIAQETFNNIVKHADASQLTVKLQLSPPYSLDQSEAWYGWVTLSICDNGRGFDPSYVAPGKLGLTIMRERAQSIGAALNLESRPGGGTEVRLSWQNSEGRG